MASARRITSSSSSFSAHIQFSSGYVCLRCQRRAILSAARPRNVAPTSAAYLLPLQRRYATNRPENDDFEGSFADKLRKKIWGTDHPPGQRNPYVRESPEETEERLAEEEARMQEEEDRAREAEDFERLAGTKGSLSRQEDEAIPEEAVYEEVVDDPNGQIGDHSLRDPGENYEYKPATTWRGLRHVPAWKVVQMAPQFTGFLSPQKTDDPEAVGSVIQRALVEIWTLKQASLPLTIPKGVGNVSDVFVSRLGSQTKFKSTPSGERILEYNDPSLQEEVILSLGHGPNQDLQIQEAADDVLELDESLLVGDGPRQMAQTSDIASVGSEAEQTIAEELGESRLILGQPTTEAPSDEVLAPVDKSWRGVSIKNPDIRFAVLKRVMQLTGTRIPDPQISRLHTAEDLLALLIKPPKPTKLADKLIANDKLVNSPHLELYDTRWTEQDREMEIGRWKLITAELSRRGLPHDPRDIRHSSKARKDAL